ncbi:phosphoglycolate phosphatase-like HAD superfamily hydrolase [Kribbella steppae]|uniref:Phosphoglycolate phosphatase-like HAD superfamily hydrolase n=1 Tax=Kribbella steppae TaxID=2512223 RepID=A0A4R2H2G8_9ACTN|nr:HAD family hydrolase [Kribbella steppae]TCO17340.1 phosphoglycolate phosphatase-like HAD superfamily hydrolase [Kribbella steppae]
MISHVVWDWNGTLLNDNDAVLAAVNAVCVDFGCASLTWAEWQALYARPMRVSYEQILQRPLDDEEWARVDKLYHERYDALLHTCGLATGVPAELQRWAESGRTQSLLSMWFHARLVPTIDQFGLTGYFSRIDGLPGDVGGGSKTDSLRQHLEAQSLDPADVVLIGDVVDDALAAQAAGTHCILVNTGAMAHIALEATGLPVTNSIQEALHLLDS